MPIVRLSKIVMTAGLSLFAFLVAFGNVTDYGSNFAFVRHVLSMDTIFPDSTLGWRAITSPALHHAAYALIIAAEALTCIAFAYASWRMAAAFRAPLPAFRLAKRWTALGVTIGFATWFVGFMAIGGEWFAMWQSATWNGQQPAFWFYATILMVGLYVLADTDEAC